MTSTRCQTDSSVVFAERNVFLVRYFEVVVSEHEQYLRMILPQVHLRKPCYDFYFLQAIEFERLLGQQSGACTSDRDQSEVLTEPLNR